MSKNMTGRKRPNEKEQQEEDKHSSRQREDPTAESSTSMRISSPSLAESRTRRKSAKAMKCPICLKTFHSAVMSLADINDHINRCSDAQLNYDKSQHMKDYTESENLRKKLKVDSHGNARKDVADSDKANRRQSMESLKKSGELRPSFEYLLLKHLDP